MRALWILAVAALVGVIGALVAAPALAQERRVERLSESLATDWARWNPGGAPVSQDFVLVALRQGLRPVEVLEILDSQALEGAHTSGSYSSPELVHYFTQNPELIPELQQVVRSIGPREPMDGSYDQRLQQAVFGIGDARQAYLDALGKVEVPGFGVYSMTDPTYQALVRLGFASMPDGGLPAPEASYQARMGIGS